MRVTPLVLLLAVAAAAGCSYDWAYSGADAATDGGSLDASHDASAAPDGENDATVDATAGDAAAEAEAAPLPPCTTSQEADVQQKRAAALVCTGVTPNPCELSVTDECGCEVVVATNDQAEADYLTAIKNLLAACIPSCPSQCTTPNKGLCIVGDGGAGVLTCHQ